MREIYIKWDRQKCKFKLFLSHFRASVFKIKSFAKIINCFPPSEEFYLKSRISNVQSYDKIPWVMMGETQYRIRVLNLFKVENNLQEKRLTLR
jgi:hypothetical protein